ncbi:hypothetical protein PUNSTDRAFT_47716 [Punctularia strigosozonata HHB-11173 SS5]|uniref:Uncharacterized protein n=1 Tax=Punctularia strigosozonata (strain HHB-11173) TaxID=741275 RepID=R7S1F6_PUNST|nr:uncharacterized protein PUNSTDRAFT_47716 [Punctularia strigosozonata HHB-11173 SS5]EIN04210.1 hypothetical protein PUNSTDRAFT_47716 [Punctularia strigosozonata HHB-11173 SS5]
MSAQKTGQVTAAPRPTGLFNHVVPGPDRPNGPEVVAHPPGRKATSTTRRTDADLDAKREWDADAAADRAVGIGVRRDDWKRWSGQVAWDVEAAADRAVGRGARLT